MSILTYKTKTIIMLKINFLQFRTRKQDSLQLVYVYWVDKSDACDVRIYSSLIDFTNDRNMLQV